MSNEVRFKAGSDFNNYWHTYAVDGNGYCFVGDFIGGNENGAIRFPGVTGSGNCNEAQLYFKVGFTTGSNTGPMELIVYGIDEDNTGSFTSDPMGRTRTTASVTWYLDRPDVGDYVNINITSIVNEIRNRPGWSSGNALGIHILESGNTGDDTYFSGGPDSSTPSSDTSLMIRESASPDTNPTPGTVSAPSFPSTTGYGLKISKPGINVGTASNTDLWFTTDKKVPKVLKEGGTVTPSGLTSINHGLGYTPMFLAYANSIGTATKRFKLPRSFYDTDPVGGGIEGDVSANGTNVFVRIESAGTVNSYYYAFVDKLP